jgi:hypothetical protein
VSGTGAVLVSPGVASAETAALDPDMWERAIIVLDFVIAKELMINSAVSKTTTMDFAIV